MSHPPIEPGHWFVLVLLLLVPEVVLAESVLSEAEDLFGTSHNAADLEYRPAPWDWATPVTYPRLTQALPPEPASSDLLDEVSVTATRRPTRERDTTATTYVVKQEDFRAQGARTVPEALQLIPGFESQPALGGVRNARGVFLRGFDDQRFQLLRDGISLQRSQNNRNDISRVAVEDLERIEVVTGGATLRYGSGAVGGVINLITQTPTGPPRLTLGYEVGNYGNSTYLARYGGGDDTLSYNFVYTGIVAFNDYPYRFTLPNQAQFYGPSTNPDAPSFGLSNPDPRNSGPVDLFGFLTPEVGPPLTVTGRTDSAFAASDNYTAKLVARPDVTNRLTLRLNQQNSKNAGNGPGTYALGACFAGPAAGNGTLEGQTRFLPLDRSGNELPCSTQRFIVNTPSSAVALPYTYNASANGVPFPTGQSYPTEAAIGTTDFYISTFQSQTEAALLWDHDLTPTTSLNSYVSLYRFSSPRFRPTSFPINSNFLGGEGDFRVGALGQSYFEGNKFEVQTALNTQISPGQTLSFGLNFTEDRNYQQEGRGATFLDRTIARSSAFVIDDISFSPQLKANLGLRYTYSTQFGVVATPAVGLRYSPSRLVSLRANWSQVFNAPSITDLFVAGGIFRPNPALRPETGITYDVGVDITPQSNLAFRATYFNTYLDGAIGTFVFRNPDPADPNLFLQQQRNLDSRRASGIEFTGDWQVVEYLRVRAVWTNTDARNFGPVDSIDNTLFFYQYQDLNIPFNRATLAVSYAGEGVNATLLGRYSGGQRRGEDPFGVPARATLDLNVDVPLTPFLTLNASVFNLTDTSYEYTAGVPAPGITFRVGGRFTLGQDAP